MTALFFERQNYKTSSGRAHVSRFDGYHCDALPGAQLNTKALPLCKESARESGL
jgi:hypothetical protein